MSKADRAAALRLVPVSRETEARLAILADLLRRWQARTNLVAPATLDHLWTRHIADSAQIVGLAPDVLTWADLGSGAGFPGLVIAAHLADRPGAVVHLLESDQKKSAFLREAARQMAVPVRIHADRIEKALPGLAGQVEAVTARALASLEKLLSLAAPLLTTGARGFFLKGRDVERELVEASRSWVIEAQLVPSRTDLEARIVIVDHLARRGGE
jgi:16S rRNA (guanine527-N7)-methyltransferase